MTTAFCAKGWSHPCRGNPVLLYSDWIHQHFLQGISISWLSTWSHKEAVWLRGHSLTLDQLNAPPNAGFSLTKDEERTMTPLSLFQSVLQPPLLPLQELGHRRPDAFFCPPTCNWKALKENRFPSVRGVRVKWKGFLFWKLFHWLGRNQTCGFKKGGCWLRACSHDWD